MNRTLHYYLIHIAILQLELQFLMYLQLIYSLLKHHQGSWFDCCILNKNQWYLLYYMNQVSMNWSPILLWIKIAFVRLLQIVDKLNLDIPIYHLYYSGDFLDRSCNGNNNQIPKCILSLDELDLENYLCLLMFLFHYYYLRLVELSSLMNQQVMIELHILIL